MSRKNKSSRRSRGSSKNPPEPPPSDERPPPPRKKKPPLRLLPPFLEKLWTAEEIWALMIQAERSNLMGVFSDTPEYWKSIAPYFPGSSAENLRRMHLSILALQRTITPWRIDEIQILIASVYGYMQQPEDTPQWWGEIASNLPRRTALDCRVAYNTYGLSRWLSEPRQQEMRRAMITSSTTTDAVITSLERTSIEPPKSEGKEKEQQEETREPSVPKSTMDAGDTSTQGTPEVADKTKSKGKKKKKKKKQQEETMEPSVPSSTIDAGGTSTNRTSEEPLKTLSKGKEKQQQEETSDQSSPSITMDALGTSSERTSEAARETTSKGKEKLLQEEDTRHYRFANSITFPGSTSTQTPEEFSMKTSEDWEMLQVEQEKTWHQYLFENSTTFPGVTSSQTQEMLPQQEEIRKHSFESTSFQETPEEIPMRTFKGKEKLQQQEEMRPHKFADSTTCTGDTSQKTSKDVPKTTSKEKEKLQQKEEKKQHSVAGSTTYPKYTSSQKNLEEIPKARGTTFPGRGTSSQRSFVDPLKNWKLEDYMILMKALTSNLHVDTDNAYEMQNIGSRIGGKSGEEVSYLILKWRPQLLAALEKADRISGSSSGTKKLETSDSSEE